MTNKILVHIDDDMYKLYLFCKDFTKQSASDESIKLVQANRPCELHTVIVPELNESPVDLTIVSDVEMPDGGFPGTVLALRELVKTAKEKINSIKLMIWSYSAISSQAQSSQVLDQYDFAKLSDILPSKLTLVDLSSWDNKKIHDITKKILRKIGAKVPTLDLIGDKDNVKEILRQITGADA